jgi:hypothetical protein
MVLSIELRILEAVIGVLLEFVGREMDVAIKQQNISIT